MIVSAIKKYLILALVCLSSGALFSQVLPSDIPDNVLWLDGGDRSTMFQDDAGTIAVTSDGDGVRRWEDKSGFGNHGILNTGINFQPASYRSIISEQVNGNSVLNFEKTGPNAGAVFKTPIDIRSSVNEDITCFAVYRAKEDLSTYSGGMRMQAVWGHDNGGWDRFYYAGFSPGAVGTDGVDDGLVSFGGGSAGKAVDRAYLKDVVLISSCIYDGNGGLESSAVYFNGELSERFQDLSSPVDAEPNLYIGWDGDGGTFDGDILEVIFYNRLLTDCELYQIYTYLNNKYDQNFTTFSAEISPSSATASCPPFEVTFMNESKNGGSFEWDFGNGDMLSTTSNESQTATFTSSAQVRLISFLGDSKDPVCSDTAYADISIEPSNSEVNLGEDITLCKGESVILDAGSAVNENYLWQDGSTNQTITANQSGTYLVKVGVGDCIESDSIIVTFSNCGCTDALATNYDTDAVFDDGTCFYPTVSVETPNIFTPNNDNINDLFELTPKNAMNVDLLIISRWGNTVHADSGINPTWDGTNLNGKAVSEGTYFYKYIAVGFDGKSIDGQGSVYLSRD